MKTNSDLENTAKRVIGTLAWTGVTLRDAVEIVKLWLVEHDEEIKNETLARKFRDEVKSGDGAPEGTRESLATCVKMLNDYAKDLYPANELGQIHFARAIMESTADEIQAFLRCSDDR